MLCALLPSMPCGSPRTIQKEHGRPRLQTWRYDASQDGQTLPRRGIILEPLCGKVFGPEDHEMLLERGGAIVGLDCSWAQIESSVETVMRRTRLQPRMLPLLLAANPVNWGNPGD